MSGFAPGGNRERKRPTWWDRYPEEELTCVRCLQTWHRTDLDRLLWCEECRAIARGRASRIGWMAGVVLAALLAGWIWLVVQPSRDLVLGGWIATVVAACWLGAKITREIVYGFERFKNRRAIEATPPTDPAGDAP